MDSPRALITGITGQDGSYLAEFLLGKGYEVFGLVRRSSSKNFERIAHILPRIHLVQGDLLDQSSLMRALSESRPAEIYNLAAQSFVPYFSSTRSLASSRHFCRTSQTATYCTSGRLRKARWSPEPMLPRPMPPITIRSLAGGVTASPSAFDVIT